MNNPGKLQVTTPSDREIAMTRVFDAPRNLVFDAWTKPELLRQWLGVFREIVKPERIVVTEKFDESWYEGDATDTTLFVEKGGKTTVTTTVRYQSKEVRDGVLKSPMETGVAASYDHLAEILASKLSGKAK